MRPLQHLIQACANGEFWGESPRYAPAAAPVVALFLIALLVSSCSLAEDITPPPGYQDPVFPTPAPTAAVVAAAPAVAPDASGGAGIYAEKCAPCHGAAGQGDGPQSGQLPNPAPPIGDAALARQASPAAWYEIVTRGNLDRFMPPFGNSLTDRQRWDVIAYTFALSISPDELAEGERLYQASCAGCHGEDGRGSGPEAPAGILLDFTDLAYAAERSAADAFNAITLGISPGMPAFESQLSENERWALAVYLRELAFGPAKGDSAPRAAVTEPSQATPVAAADLAAGEDPVEAEAATGRVSGRVVNGSGGPLAAGLAVTLHGFEEMTEVYSDTVALSADGVYAFEEVAFPEGRILLATVEYGETVYGSEFAVVGPGIGSLDLQVTIYETTTDPSDLFIDRLHIFLEFQSPDFVEVTELYLISNPGNEVVVPASASEPVVTFSVPPEATNIQFQDGEMGGRFVVTEGGFGDTASVRPGSGQYQVLFGYTMPFDGKLELIQTLNLPASAVILLMPDDGVRVRSDHLQDTGVRDIQGESYRVFTGGSLGAGGQLALSLSGRAASAGAAPLAVGSISNLAIGLGAFGAALLVAGVWLYRRSREEEPAEDLVLESAQEVFTDTDTLMDAIIALDDLYQAGDLPLEAYQERRAELKGRLAEALELAEND